MNLILDEPATTPPAPAAAQDIHDTAATAAAQRETDFHRTFTWRGKTLALTVIGELYYRELRTHCMAPPLADYATLADYVPEAARLIYCASLDRKAISALRMQPPQQQVQSWEEWTERNIALHELDAVAQTAQEMQQAILRARTQPAADDGEEQIDGVGN